MSFWAYMLHCRGGAYYTGHTDNLAHRIAQHESGAFPGFTADRLPVALVWSQEFSTRIEALEAERRIKGRSEENTSELQSLMRHSYAVFCLKKKPYKQHTET